MIDFRGARILVTGAAGFIGANLVHRLTAEGAVIHALVRPSSKLWRIQSLLDRITVHSADLKDASAVQQAMQASKPDFIFDVAAERAAVQDRSLIQRHVAATLNMLEAASSMQFIRFVRAASSMEYGKKKKKLTEDNPLDPDHPFSVGKATSALICREFARSEQRPLVILRLFSVFGPWEPAHRLIPTAMLACILGNELNLTAPGFFRDFVFIDDVVEAFFQAATIDLPPGEVINVCTGVQTSNEDAVDLVQQILGKQIKINIGSYPARHSDTSFWVGDPSKAASLLKWKANHDLRSGLEKTAAWFCEHVNDYK